MGGTQPYIEGQRIMMIFFCGLAGGALIGCFVGRLWAYKQYTKYINEVCNVTEKMINTYKKCTELIEKREDLKKENKKLLEVISAQN